MIPAAFRGARAVLADLESDMRLKLPAAFIRDCIECECDVGRYLDGHLYADAEQLCELRNRAEFYADGGADLAGSLIWPARALLRALDKFDRPVID